MPDEKKPRHPEINFLPPLNMLLAFFKKKNKDQDQAPDMPAAPEKKTDEKAVEKIIEKLNKEK